jgi:hypothetical protein
MDPPRNPKQFTNEEGACCAFPVRESITSKLRCIKLHLSRIVGDSAASCPNLRTGAHVSASCPNLFAGCASPGASRLTLRAPWEGGKEQTGGGQEVEKRASASCRHPSDAKVVFKCDTIPLTTGSRYVSAAKWGEGGWELELPFRGLETGTATQGYEFRNCHSGAWILNKGDHPHSIGAPQTAGSERLMTKSVMSKRRLTQVLHFDCGPLPRPGYMCR